MLSYRMVLGITAASLLGFLLLLGILRGGAVPKAASPIKKSAAIVLLAGNFQERAPVAASLHRAGYAPRILLTNDGVRKGYYREYDRNLYAIEATAVELLKLGVPRQAIVLLPFRKSGTVYDALAVKEYLVGEKLDSIILVTSDYHVRRACWIFHRVLRPLPVSISTVPAVSGTLPLWKAALEPIKLVYYLVRFGLVTEPAGL